MRDKTPSTVSNTSSSAASRDTGPVILKFERRTLRVERPPVYRDWFSGPRSPHQLSFAGTVE